MRSPAWVTVDFMLSPLTLLILGQLPASRVRNGGFCHPGPLDFRCTDPSLSVRSSGDRMFHNFVKALVKIVTGKVMDPNPQNPNKALKNIVLEAFMKVLLSTWH